MKTREKRQLGRAVVLAAIAMGFPALASCNDSTPQRADAPVITTPAQKEMADLTKVYDVVVEMPHFPGGPEACLEFIKNNLRYPKSCKENGIQGRVIVHFVVNTDGSLSDARVVKSVCEEMNQEALRIISIMPRWIPGKLNGTLVKVRFVLPITFRLDTKE